MSGARRATKRHIEDLRRLPFTAGCTKAELGRFDQLGVRIDVPVGRVLTLEGGPGRECFVVVDGLASVSRAGAAIGIIGPGSLAGELALLYDVPRTATVMALTPMTVLALSIREFKTLLDISPCIRTAVNNIAATRAGAEGLASGAGLAGDDHSCAERTVKHEIGS
jgi:CRP-like cAMP-binding protein